MDAETRARLVAENESLFRDVNERIEEVSGRWENEAASFVCECGTRGCSEMVALTLEQYATVREHPARFVVRPGHELLEFERIVEQGDGYTIVEKVGLGAEIAEELDPRGD